LNPECIQELLQLTKPQLEYLIWLYTTFTTQREKSSKAFSENPNVLLPIKLIHTPEQIAIW
jgi:hypothetical protein